MNTHMTSTLAQCVWRRQWSLWVNAGPGGDGSAAVYVPQPTQLGRYSAKRFNSPFCAQHCISTFYAQLASGPLNDIYCTTHQAYLTWLIAHRAVPEHEVRPVLIQINWRADKAQLAYFNLKMCFGQRSLLLEKYTVWENTSAFLEEPVIIATSWNNTWNNLEKHSLTHLIVVGG